MGTVRWSLWSNRNSSRWLRWSSGNSSLAVVVKWEQFVRRGGQMVD